MVSRKTVVIIGRNPATVSLLEQKLHTTHSIASFNRILQALDFFTRTCRIW